MELVTKLKEMIPWRRKPVEPSEVVSLRDDINRLFDRFLMPFDRDWSLSKGWGYGHDLEETDDEVIVRLEVPGLDPKELDVTVREGMLHVRYEQKDEWLERNGDMMGRRYSTFSRTVSLPEGLNPSHARANCKHGLLTVRIPRTEEAKRKSRRITISID